MRMKISVLCLLVFVSYAFYGVFSAISITSFPPGCVGLWTCLGCSTGSGTITVNAVNTAGTSCNAVNDVFPTSCVDEIAVFSDETDQFYYVSCLDSNGNPVAKVKCTETCVINFGATAGFCASPGSNSDYLRTDNEVVTYDCSGTDSQCEFTSYPGTVVQYYYDVSGSGNGGSSTSPDCICENTDVTPSGSPLSCTSFTTQPIDTTDPACFNTPETCFVCPAGSFVSSMNANGQITCEYSDYPCVYSSCTGALETGSNGCQNTAITTNYLCPSVDIAVNNILGMALSAPNQLYCVYTDANCLYDLNNSGQLIDSDPAFCTSNAIPCSAD